MTIVPALTSNRVAPMARYILVHRNKLLCGIDGVWQGLLLSELKTLALPTASEHYLGWFDHHEYWVLEIPGVTEPSLDNWRWLGLRSQLGMLSEGEFILAGKALQILQWHCDHQYCGRCGRPTLLDAAERAKYCENCALYFYPRLSPCVIALIIRGNECLLARHLRSSLPIHTALAGFIEVGERPEDTVIREVYEEVGLKVEGLTYCSSQPWPFPGQLMLGFFASCADGDIKIDQREIIEAGWFRYDNLPPVPPLATLSGQLIARFVEQCQQQATQE